MSMETLYKKKVILPGGRKCTLEIHGLFNGVPERAVFLEDFLDKNNLTRQIFLAASNTVYKSSDNGETWSSIVCRGIRGPIVRCLTLKSGKHLVQTFNPYGLYLAKADFSSAQPVKSNAETLWHGSWSADQAETGTICFCEYTDYDQYSRIVASRDGGITWEDSLVIENVPGEQTSIRHFHYVQSDPYIEARWYAASGDKNHECRFWLSDDDARTWKELDAPNIVGEHPLIDLKDRRRIYRVVALHIGKDHLFWPTDDLLNPYSPGFFRMSKHAPFQVDYICDAGKQELRSCIDLGNGQFVAISQSNPTTDYAGVFLLGIDGESTQIAKLPKLKSVTSSFCRSMASRKAPDGIFFSYAGGNILDQRPRAFRWKISFS